MKNIRNNFGSFFVCFSYFEIFSYHFISKFFCSEMLGKILNKKGLKIRMDTKFIRNNVHRISKFFRISFRIRISYVFRISFRISFSYLFFVSFSYVFRMFFVFNFVLFSYCFVVFVRFSYVFRKSMRMFFVNSSSNICQERPHLRQGRRVED